MKTTKQETVVITGATAGIGRATARLFAERGARIGLLSRDQDRLEATRREVEELGGEAVAVSVDVADALGVEAAAEQIEREFGPIDIWINNAMTTVFAPFSEIAAEDFRRVTDVTYHGYVWGTMAALKRMRQRNRGTIVQVGSALAYRSIPLQSAYCGAKHAILGFTESIRTELLHENSKVHITMVQMPAVNTPQFEWCATTLDRHPQPMGKVFQPEVAARAVVWASHARRREIYVGMPSRMAIVADKLVPGLVDRYVARTGFAGQQAEAPISADRPANLWRPVAGEFAAHGSFDHKATKHSVSLWLSMNRNWLLAGGIGLALLQGMRARAK